MIRAIFAISLVVAVAAPLTAWSDSAITGTVVVAKTEGDAIVLWDVTKSVKAFAEGPGSTDDKMHRLEIEAAKILLARLGEMPAASTVSVRVLYQEIGAVNPAYAANTLQGVEKVVVVTAPRAAAAHNSAAWQAALDKGELPSGINASVTGQLPP